MKKVISQVLVNETIHQSTVKRLPWMRRSEDPIQLISRSWFANQTLQHQQAPSLVASRSSSRIQLKPRKAKFLNLQAHMYNHSLRFHQMMMIIQLSLVHHTHSHQALAATSCRDRNERKIPNLIHSRRVLQVCKLWWWRNECSRIVRKWPRSLNDHHLLRVPKARK